MFDLPIEDLVFLVCTLIAGGLLLITVVLDDVLGGIFEALNIDIGGASLMPLLLSFVAMFGVGGLFATQVMGLNGAAAAAVGVLSGAAGAGLAFGLLTFLQRSVSPNPFSIQDLVGVEAYVSVAIPKTKWGTVSLSAEGQTHEFRATAAKDIGRGQLVRVTGVAGTGLMVEVSDTLSTDEPTAPGVETAQQRSHGGGPGSGTT